MTKPAVRLEPVKADGQTCARCGADRAEVRRNRAPGIPDCESHGPPYKRHIWKWRMDE